jgi:murein DD-endopeptidase MepM/ murein hydrolase activator NlpD
MTPKKTPKAAESLPAIQLVNPFYGERPTLQGFGDHEEVYKRAGFKGHMGLDFGMVKQPVLAAHDGVVEFAGDGGEWPTMGSAAGTCILLEGDGFKTGYAHLHHSYVGFGEKVKAGDVIGISGDTGATTGFHLHFELIPMPYNHSNGYAGRIDPTPYLPAVEAPLEEAPTPTPVEGTLE